MKHALIAASLVLVAGLGAGCGGGDDSGSDASADASTSAPATKAEFCEAYTSLATEFAGKQPPKRIMLGTRSFTKENIASGGEELR